MLKNKFNLWIILIASLLLSLFRPLFFSDSLIYDSQFYVQLVEAFQGKISFNIIPTAWRIRLLVPFLASIFPTDPLISLNIISLIFNLLTIFYFYKFVGYFANTYKQQILGLLLFIFIVPTIILGLVPLVDSAGIFFIILSLCVYESRKHSSWLPLIIGIGILAKETVFFVAPLILIWRLIDIQKIFKTHGFKYFKQWNVTWRKLIKEIGLMMIIPFGILLFLKFWAPDEQFLIMPKLIQIQINIQELFSERMLATISQLIVILIIGIYGNYAYILFKDKTVWKLIIGMLIFIIPIGYSFFYENISFRFFWPIFIFVIPMLIQSIDRLSEL